MILSLDSANDLILITLLDGKETIASKEWRSSYNQSEKLLSVLDQFLTENNLSGHDLSAIMVNPGPGSYTGLRVGITTANCLGLALNIPVIPLGSKTETKNGGFDKPLLPVYLNPPVITKSKTRL